MKGGRGGPEEEGDPDRWAPPVGEREREEREGGGGVGRVGLMQSWAAAGWVGLFSFFSFQIHFQTF
jgi:hypothetical protein